MSITTEILRLQGAKSAIAEAIEGKGVIVPAATTIDGYADLVEQISVGETVKHKVTWFDYDGTILKEEEVVDGGTSTAPTVPSHQYLEFLYWTEGATLTNITYDIFNIALHKCTEDDKVIYKVNVPEGEELVIIMSGTANRNAHIDWGDGTYDDWTCVNGINTRKHIYSSGYQGYVILSSSYTPVPIRAGKGDTTLHFIEEVYVGNNTAKTTTETYTSGLFDLKACVIQSNMTTLNYELKNSRQKVWVIPNTITSIVNAPGDNYVLLEQYLNLPPSLTNISSLSRGYLHLNKLPKSITTLGGNCFMNCYTAEFGDGVIDLPNLTSVGSNTFNGASKVKEVKDLGDITSVSNGMFANCASLEKVTLSSKITSIVGSFDGCGKLKTILYDKDSITSIGQNSFHNCVNLESEMEFNNLSDIGSGTFYNCQKVPSIKIGGSLTSIGTTAGSGIFWKCYNLKTLMLPSDATYVKGMIDSCISLEEFAIPEGITAIVQNDLAYCHSLKRLVIPASVTSIAQTFMQNAYCLEELEFKGSPTFTNMTNSFANNLSLKKIIIPQGFIPNLGLSWNANNNLSRTDMMNFINNLGTNTGSAITISLGALNLSRLTNEDIAVATTKGYTLA